MQWTWTLGDGEEQGDLTCYIPQGHKESDRTGWLNSSNKLPYLEFYSFWTFWNLVFFLINLFNWRLLYNSVVIFAIIDMNQPLVYMCPPSWSPLPPPSPPHPSGSSQCTSPEHPVSCIKPGLAIYFTYDNIHVSMLFSQIIPPLPSPRVQKSVLYICVSFAVSHIGSSLPSF